jgi:GINS complex subunit 3
LELPLWLAELLAISGISPESQTSFISLLTPSFFTPKVLNALKSDPVSLDLNAQCPVYYRMAQRWLSIFGDPELAEVVSETLRARAVSIFDHAHNINAGGGDFLFKLDEFEKNLYKATHDSSKELKKWNRKSP